MPWRLVPCSLRDMSASGRAYPLLPAGPEDPTVGASLVAGVLAFCDGVAAFDERDALVGFLTAFDQTPDPSSPVARYSPERASVHLVHGHAVAGSVDPSPVYAAMFGVLAERALGRGVVDFVAHVPIGDAAVEAAWVALGFGRVNAVAIRDLAPTAASVDVGRRRARARRRPTSMWSIVSSTKRRSSTPAARSSVRMFASRPRSPYVPTRGRPRAR